MFTKFTITSNLFLKLIFVSQKENQMVLNDESEPVLAVNHFVEDNHKVSNFISTQMFRNCN